MENEGQNPASGGKVLSLIFTGVLGSVLTAQKELFLKTTSP